MAHRGSPYTERYGHTWQPSPRRGRLAVYSQTVAEWDTARNELAAAQRDGIDNDRIEALKAKVTTHEELVQMAEIYVTGGPVNKHEGNYAKANAELAEGLGGQLEALTALDTEKDKYPTDYVTAQRAVILDKVRITDANASQALAAYQAEALLEARKLRASAEAEIDPTTRLADELERQRLVQSSTDGNQLARQAAEMLNADQPHRASVLLAAAKDKGARMVSELELALEDALDQADPTRAKARDLEEAFVRNTAEFNTARLGMLAKYGVGIGPDGSAGTGSAGQAARASLSAKLTAYSTARSNGTDYVEPSGVLSGVPAMPEPAR